MPFDLALFRDLAPNRDIIWFEAIDSTMHEAARLALGGCPSGACVGADEQLAGHGRFGRKWHSEKESGLYVSIVLRIPAPPEDLPVVTLALGLAAAEAIASESGVACDLRWPNDVLISGRKCAGILVQLHETALVAGIGINVNQTAFPEDVRALATSLRIASGREHSRERLLAKLLDSIDEHCELLVSGGKQPILKMFSRASSYVYGRRVVVDQEGSEIRGTTDGLNEAGFLIVREDSGKRTVILAGGVRPA